MFGISPRLKRSGENGPISLSILGGAVDFGSFFWIVGKKRVSLANSKLTTLQKDFLDAFFGREDRFFLTGGAALAGFHLGHRETHDLDLFTLSDALDDGLAVVTEIALQWGASLETIHTSPDFRRRIDAIPRRFDRPACSYGVSRIRKNIGGRDGDK